MPDASRRSPARPAAAGLAAARRASTPAPADGAPPGTARWCCSARTGRASGTSFRASPEFGDGGADPLDRWSARVIGGLAASARRRRAVFPFGGPPWRAVHRLGAAERRGLGRRRSACWSTPASGSSSPTAARWPSATRLDAALGRRAPLRRLRRALPDRLPGRRARRARATTSRPATASSTPRRAGTASTAAARCAAPARSAPALRPEAQSAFHMADFHGRQCGMRRLILMRHAKSSWADPGQRDLDRPLNKRGRRGAGADRRLDEAQGLPPGPGAGLERPAHPGDLVGDRRRGRRGARPTTCPSSTMPAPTTCSRCCSARRTCRLRADARAPAGDRRLRRAAAGRPAARGRSSPSTRPARPRSSISTPRTGPRSAGAGAGSSTSWCRARWSDPPTARCYRRAG